MDFISNLFFSFLFFVQYLAVILMGMVFVWFRAANSLSVQFDAAMEASMA